MGRPPRRRRLHRLGFGGTRRTRLVRSHRTGPGPHRDGSLPPGAPETTAECTTRTRHVVVGNSTAGGRSSSGSGSSHHERETEAPGAIPRCETKRGDDAAGEGLPGRKPRTGVAPVGARGRSERLRERGPHAADPNGPEGEPRNGPAAPGTRDWRRRNRKHGDRIYGNGTGGHRGRHPAALPVRGGAAPRASPPESFRTKRPRQQRQQHQRFVRWLRQFSQEPLGHRRLPIRPASNERPDPRLHGQSRTGGPLPVLGRSPRFGVPLCQRLQGRSGPVVRERPRKREHRPLPDGLLRCQGRIPEGPDSVFVDPPGGSQRVGPFVCGGSPSGTGGKRSPEPHREKGPPVGGTGGIRRRCEGPRQMEEPAERPRVLSRRRCRRLPPPPHHRGRKRHRRRSFPGPPPLCFEQNREAVRSGLPDPLRACPQSVLRGDERI
mmetsp:Transcript_2083/g.4511  ORF Transcript_2083/g.4511 Transcript_2083/m.4511 type:complete len:435 (-) Transcript_2083:1937-3241(-)